MGSHPVGSCGMPSALQKCQPGSVELLVAAALEEITLHPADEVALAFRLMLAVGLVLTVVGER
jgi:hypothetical protein